MKSTALSFFFGGLLPILAFTLIEDKYGPFYGTIAGMVFGIGEIIYEKIRNKKVSGITWGGNALILILGTVSIVFDEGFWFKLQPAIFEAVFTGIMWGSLLMKKPLLISMAEKQGNKVPESVQPLFKGLTFRIGLFFLVHAILATWAALHWSTSAWAWLKGAGVTVSFLGYMGLEILWLRRSVQAQKKEGKSFDLPSFPNPPNKKTEI